MRISICIPIHNMKRPAFFLRRLMHSLEVQTFQDFEVVVTKDGKMAENTNAAIKKAQGEIIKVLYMDDWLDSPYYLEALQESFSVPEIEWLITSATTNPEPYWTDDIETGNNRLGSPSALAFRNRFEDNLLFDETLSWLLDCDLYRRLHEKYGKPAILEGVNVGIGIGDHQMTNLLTNEEKLGEHKYLHEKYGKQ